MDCPGQLLQVTARNLLTNAMKYSAGRPDARVTVKVFTEGANAVLEVADNGMGMGAGVLARCCSSRSSGRRKCARFPGHGLGLARTARGGGRMGDADGARSEEGKGTHVVVRFAHGAAGGGSTAESVQSSLLPRFARWPLEHKLASSWTMTLRRGPAQRLLGPLGAVSRAANRAAQERLAEGAYDLGADGHAHARAGRWAERCCKEVKAHLPDTPVIVVTTGNIEGALDGISWSIRLL